MNLFSVASRPFTRKGRRLQREVHSENRGDKRGELVGEEEESAGHAGKLAGSRWRFLVQQRN
jgi:hypothetical protein